jgi:hypothetical protein
MAVSGVTRMNRLYAVRIKSTRVKKTQEELRGKSLGAETKKGRSNGDL